MKFSAFILLFWPGSRRIMSSPAKRKRKEKKVIPTIHVLGYFLMYPKYKPYIVCQANKAKITDTLINHLMGNTVELDRQKDAIDYLFKRDHGKFPLPLKTTFKVGQFGIYYFPLVFIHKAPDVLFADDFEEKRRKVEEQAQSNVEDQAYYVLSEPATRSKWKVINGVPIPKDHVQDGLLRGDLIEPKAIRRHH